MKKNQDNSARVTVLTRIALSAALMSISALLFAQSFTPSTGANTAGQGKTRGDGPFVSEVVTPVRVDKDLRELPYVPPFEPGFEKPEFRRHPRGEGQPQPSVSKAAIPEPAAPQPNMPILNVGFDGLDLSVSGCSCSPPDTQGDIGPNHYIQNVNSTTFRIWDKSGNILFTSTLNTLWGTGGTNPCTQGKHFGDPFVFYDHLADRWVLTDFAFGTSGPNTVAPYYECVAVSQTSNPVSGGWYLYAFQQDSANPDWLGDYPKFGMWPDAWYSSYNMFCGGSSCTFGARNSFQGVQVNAYNRTQMLAGAATTTIVSRLTPAQVGDSYTFLPATFRFGAPPAGRNEFFASIDSPATANWDSTLTKVHIWKFHVDFVTPANSAFVQDNDITVNGFTNAWDSTENGDIVPQSGTTTKLDTVGDRLFTPLWYQNLGGTESLWAAHTINDINNGPTAVRWYQFNVTGNTVATTPVQQGDITGGSLYRWMPSLSVDKSGNMAIGYTVSSSSMFPAIRYNGRLTTDPLNTLGQGESTLVAGTGSFTGSNRWGDYSFTSIDPTDGCTFWHTNEYVSTTGSNWKTRVGSFTYPVCVSANDGTLTGTVTDSSTSSPISGVTVTATSGGITNSTATNASGVYSFNLLPGTYDMTASKIGYATGSANGKVVTAGNTTTQNFSLTSSCTAVSRTWIGAGAGGAGTDFNTGSNWNPAGVPQPCDDLTMTLTSATTITLSSDITIHNLTFTESGSSSVGRLDVTNRTLTVTGTTTVDAPGGNTNTQAQFSVGNASGSAGAMIFQGNVTVASASTQDVFFRGFAGSNGQFVFKGNLTLGGVHAVTSGTNFPDKYVFNGTNQTYTNNGATGFNMTKVEIGDGTNATALTLAGTSNATLNGAATNGANLTIKAGSTLDLATHTLNRSASGGTFQMDATSAMKLAASTGGQTGSNFPLNFSTTTLNSTSTVEYNAAGGTNQTIFATPTYGNLTISRVSGVTATTKTVGAALTVAGSLTINSGAAFAASTFTHNIGGNWQNNGTFTASTSTINLNGANQSITGSTAFNNLTKNVTTARTLTFDSAGTQTISGTLNLQGASGQLLSLRSGNTGTQWNINPQGTRTIAFLDVKDSNNVNATAINANGTNSVDSGNNTNWTFAAAATSLAASSASGTYGGTANLSATLTSGVNGVSGKSISFSLNGNGVGSATTNASGVATLSSVSLSGINAGTYPTGVGASFAGDGSFTSSSGTNSLTVNPANQTITVNTHAPTSAVYNTQFTVAATASSGLAVSYSSSGVCTNSGATFTMTSGTGTCTVKYDQSGNGNYNAAPQVTESVTATKATQTITFTLPASVARAAGSVALNGTATSGLPVSYESSNTGIATVSGSTLNLVAPGSTTVTATQAGDNNYEAAAPVNRTIVVTGPIAVDDTVTRRANDGNTTIPVATLLANDTRIADDGSPQTDNLVITAVTSGTGNTVTLDGASITYTPDDATATDPLTFTYTVSDGSSTDVGTVTVGTIKLAIVHKADPVFNGSETSIMVQFSGVPSETYTIEYTTNLADVNSWTSAGQWQTTSTGSFVVTITAPGDHTAEWNAKMFFRASQSGP